MTAIILKCFGIEKESVWKAMCDSFEDNFPCSIFSVLLRSILEVSNLIRLADVNVNEWQNEDNPHAHQWCVCRFVCITLTNQHVYCTHSDKANKHFLWCNADDVVDSHSISISLALTLSIHSFIYLLQIIVAFQFWHSFYVHLIGISRYVRSFIRLIWTFIPKTETISTHSKSAHSSSLSLRFLALSLVFWFLTLSFPQCCGREWFRLPWIFARWLLLPTNHWTLWLHSW